MTEEVAKDQTIIQQNDLIGTDQTIVPKVPAPVEPVNVPTLQDLIKNVSDNPATINFPQDRWGFTSQIKTTVLKAASTVRGQDDKHDLLVATLAVLIAHVKARKAKDKATQQMVREHHNAAAAERGPRERVSGGVVNNTPVVITAE